MMRNQRRYRWTALVFWLAVLFFLTAAAGAAPVNLPFRNAYVFKNVESGDLNEYLTEPVDNFSGRWEFSGDAGEPSKNALGGLGMLFTDGASAAEGYMEFLYLDPADLTDANSLAFGIYIQDQTEDGVQTGAEIPLGVYKVSVTVTCRGTESTSYVYLDGNQWQIVYSDLPYSAKLAEVDSIRIRVEYDRQTAVGQVRITAPCVAEEDCVFVSRFSASSVTASLGEVRPIATSLQMVPDAGGAVSLVTDVVLPQYVSGETGWYLAVQAEGTAAGGEISASVGYTHTSRQGEEDIWVSSGAIEVLEGTNTYYFPLPAPTGENSGNHGAGGYNLQELQDPEFCRISFQNVKSSTGYPFRITGMEWIPAGDPDWTDSNLGTLSAGNLQNGEIAWTGKLNRQTVIDYIDAEIALMAVPVWSRYDLGTARELARCQVSNSFSFSIRADDGAAYAAGWMFYAAIRTETPTQDPSYSIVEYLPISQPKMLPGSEPAPCSLSPFGFHAANAVGVYESNVSHVTVDVYLDQLLEKTGSGVVCTFGGRSCSLNQTYLASLDSDLRFYSDAGLEVSLRLLSAEPSAVSDRMAENYLPVLTTEEEVYTYAAVVSYLCSRYPSAASITLGMGTNCEKYMGFSLEDPISVMRNVAVLAAVTYQTARLTIPDVYVVIPFADDHVYTSEDVLPDSGAVLESEWLLILLAEAFRDLGEIPWVVSWRFEDDADAAEAAAQTERWRYVLHRLSLPEFADFLYRWEPEVCLRQEAIPYSFADRYGVLCQNLEEVRPRAVILSLARVSEYVSQSMYADITVLPDPQGSASAGRQVQHLTAALYDGNGPETDGSAVTLWDFSSAYTTQDFVAGGGIEEIYTADSPRFDVSSGKSGSRVLRSFLPVSLYEDSTVGTAGGILLRDFGSVRDLSLLDSLQFTFSLTEGDFAGTPPTVVFLIGAEDWRAEYHVSGVISGDVMTAVCDLRDCPMAAGTEYIGVMLYGETELTFDLLSVSAGSREYSAEEMDAILFPSAEADKDNPYATEIFYLLVLLAAMSVCVSVILFRREREDE